MKQVIDMSDLNSNESDFLRLLERTPFDDTPTPEHRQTLRDRVLDRFEPRVTCEPARSAWQTAFRKGTQIMRRPVFRLLFTSACLAIGAFWLFVPGGQSPAQAFNRFAEAVVSAKSAKFKMEMHVEGQPKQKFQAWYLAPNKFRQELGTQVNISDFSTGKIVSIIPAEKKVVVMTIKGESKDKDKASANYFERVRELLGDRDKAGEKQYEALGEKQINGKRAIGFRFDSPASTMTMWGDPTTGQPVRIDNVWSGIPRTETTMTDFEINVDVKESQFDMTPPEGYKVQEFEVDASEAKEQDLVQAFETCAEISGGSFPDSLDTAGLMQFLIKTAIAKAKDKTGVSDDEFQALMKQSITIGRGLQFALMLPESAEAHYAGTGVKRDDKDRPILWYKPAGAKTYRVIYADLTVKDADTAPQVEGAKRILNASQTSKPAGGK
jgi:outer membrane lipoprotein-sorting protein